MKNLKICDAHCDTASEAMDKGYALFDNPLMLDIKRMKEYKSYIQFFAAFIDPEYYNSPHERCESIIKYIPEQCDKYNNDIRLCRSYSDMERTLADNKCGAFISVEGGECIKSADDIDILYSMGVRMITLTWNNDNALGGGALGDGRGLSAFGKEIVRKMNKMGMIVDVSHASEKMFYDILSTTDKPVCASHSNAYSVCPHPRNLKDEQIKELISINGVMGMNFYPVFLKDSGKCTADDILRHIDYLLSMGCENNIGIGSDFDGVESLPDGISGVSDMAKIFDKIKESGIDDKISEKIAYKNMARLIRICL